MLFKEEQLPYILRKGKWEGQILWAVAYTVLVLIPLSIPRKIGALRFNSMFGVCCSFYLVMCIVFMFFLDKNLVPSMETAWNESKKFHISEQGLLNGVPFVIFAFMYQPNIPIIYRELTDKSYSKMNKVVTSGSGFVVVMYTLVSTFGYLGIV